VISGVLSYSAGLPLRITTINTPPLFNGHLRPNPVPGVAMRDNTSRSEFRPLNAMTGEVGDRYLNPAAFTTPEPFTFGVLGVFLPDLRAFGARNENLSVSRRFRFRERSFVDLRADFLNAFNRRNLIAPILDLTNPNFGRITGQGSPRSIQLGLRVEL
jgi:hypothetical protein